MDTPIPTAPKPIINEEEDETEYETDDDEVTFILSSDHMQNRKIKPLPLRRGRETGTKNPFAQDTATGKLPPNSESGSLTGLSDTEKKQQSTAQNLPKTNCTLLPSRQQENTFHNPGGVDWNAFLGPHAENFPIAPPHSSTASMTPHNKDSLFQPYQHSASPAPLNKHSEFPVPETSAFTFSPTKAFPHFPLSASEISDATHNSNTGLESKNTPFKIHSDAEEFDLDAHLAKLAILGSESAGHENDSKSLADSGVFDENKFPGVGLGRAGCGSKVVAARKGLDGSVEAALNGSGRDLKDSKIEEETRRMEGNDTEGEDGKGDGMEFNALTVESPEGGDEDEIS